MQASHIRWKFGAYYRDPEIPDVAEMAVVELAGRDLACWCRGGPCHADVLLAIANPDQ